MSDELTALLAAIRDNPEDDLPRLALADWCLEQPDARAQARGEFIQMRIRAAALPADAAERTELLRRANELCRRHERAWLGGLEKLLEGWDFERGMALIRVTSAWLGSRQLRRLVGHPALAWVIGLRGVGLGSGEVRHLLASPLLGVLTSLDLSDCCLGAEGARTLADSAGAARLTRLTLGYAALGDAGVAALAGPMHPWRLTELTLFNNAIGPAGCVALAGAPWLAGLRVLDLSRNPIGDDGARELAGGRPTGLAELLLAGCGVGDRGATALATSVHLGGLRRLDLGDSRLKAATQVLLRERFAARVVLD